MVKRRIIACLDTMGSRVVKGVKFTNVRDYGDPYELAQYYAHSGIDELVLYDISASNEDQLIALDHVRKIGTQLGIPLTVGGGIKSLEDAKRLFDAGADKVSVNSGALIKDALISDISKIYGAQSLVLSVDILRAPQPCWDKSQYGLFTQMGKVPVGIDPFDWIQRGIDLGAGEIVVNAIHQDGTKGGFDIQLMQYLENRFSVPLIASGGAGTLSDFDELFCKTQYCSALAASIFHNQSVNIPVLKQHLRQMGYRVRV